MMEGWKTEKFKKLIDYKSGYTWSKEQELAVEEPNSIRVLTVSNVQDKLDLTSELYLAGVSEQDRIKKQVSKDWSIAVSSNGNRNRIGNAIFIDSDTNYLFASFLTAFKPFDEADISPYYFYLWLSSSFVQRKITSVAEGTTGLGNLSIRFLRNMDITFPTDKAEQTAIAKILSTVDEAIRSTRETISKLERVKKSLMQNLLSGKMKPDGTLRPATEFYEDEKMGLVPKGWKSVKLKEVVLRPGEYGANASAITYEEGKVRFIRITDINDDGTLSEDDKAGLDNEIAQKYLLKEDDFLFARTGDTIGKSLLYKESMGLAAFAGYLIKFTFDKQKIVPELFQLIANSEIFEAFKVSMKRVGAKPNINSREYGNFRFIMPEDIKSQKQIVSSFEPITKQITTNNKKITALESLKKSLMQQLLTGKVRVKC